MGHRALFSILLIAALGLAAVGQSPFTAQGSTEGKTILWFLGTEITIEVIGALALDVAFVLGETSIALSSEGKAFGRGIGDSYTLATTLWLLFDTTGWTGDGRPVDVRGGARLIGDQVDFTTMSLGSGSGTFILTLTLDDVSHILTGTLSATAEGLLVPAEQPGTMQVEGGGTFAFAGDPIEVREDLCSAFPWDETGWPEEFVPHLLAVLMDEPLPEEPSEADTP